MTSVSVAHRFNFFAVFNAQKASHRVTARRSRNQFTAASDQRSAFSGQLVVLGASRLGPCGDTPKILTFVLTANCFGVWQFQPAPPNFLQEFERWWLDLPERK